MRGPGIFSSVHAKILPERHHSESEPDSHCLGLNLAASQARGRRTEQQDHLQGKNSIECNVTGGLTINWEDAGIYAGSVFSHFVALLAAWAEDQMLSQIKALEKNGLTVRSLHGPCALLERCTAQRQPATLGNEQDIL